MGPREYLKINWNGLIAFLILFNVYNLMVLFLFG